MDDNIFQHFSDSSFLAPPQSKMPLPLCLLRAEAPPEQAGNSRAPGFTSGKQPAGSPDVRDGVPA